MPKVKSTSVAKTSSKKEAGPLEDFFGFKVLPVIVKDGTRHFMYMAQHEVRSESDTLPADRTLFLVNLPVDTTDAHLQYLFRSHGAIASIIYHGAIGGSLQQQQQQQEPSSDDTTAFNSSNLGSSYTSTLIKPKEDKKLKYSKKRKQQDLNDNHQDAADLDNDSTQLRRLLHSGASAHVVFSRNDSLDSILAMTRIVRKWTVDEEYTSKTLQPLGFQRKYKSIGIKGSSALTPLNSTGHLLAFELSRPDHGELQQQVDSYMMKFKENEYQKERDLLDRMNKMDEDGFVVVSRHKKKRNTDGEIQVTATSSASAASYDPTKAKKKKELVDFYRFQLREKKQNGKW